MRALPLLMLFAVPLHADVTLIDKGQARFVIVAPARVMEPDKKLTSPNARDTEAEAQRQRLRASVNDLARVLRVMSGATVDVRSDHLPAGDRRTHIFVGEPAEKAFGPVGQTAPYKQGFRYFVSPKGVGLYGESDLASSYAVYELLDRLGCRWYLPGDLGEVIPESKTVTLPEADVKTAPATIYRSIWYADEAYKRRNRMGGLLLSAGHALEMYVSAEDRQKHPEWRAEIGGKPDPHRLRWSSPTLADFLADKILGQHAKDPHPSYSLSPDDGATWDESKDDKAIDAADFDPTLQTVSKTDRLMVLCNRVATKVAAKEPDVLLGVLAYVDYTRPPVREKVHPNLVPQLAPITYSRAHPMTDDRVPGNKELRALVEGWGKKARMTSLYFYGWFLAEPTAPNPMTTKWGTDAPIVLANNCQFWQPETLPNFETSMHGLYLGNRLAFDPKLKPQAIIDELHAKFYGHAATAMAAYWAFIDKVWVETPEYSGCGFGYLRRWTPENMATARKLLDAGRSACRTPMEEARVQLADDSLKLFELFIKLRHDQAEGRFANLAEEGEQWLKRVVELGERYKASYCFSRVGWTSHTVGGGYFRQFYQQTYADAARIAKNYDVLTTPPLRQFHIQWDPEAKGEAAGWAKPELDDSAWPTTDVCTETWSTLGHHDYMKSAWYRTTVDLPAVPKGQRTYLWLGSFDGKGKVFVNGKLVRHAGGHGKTSDSVTGYCQPFSFDITDVAKPGRNSVAIFFTRTDVNELGTGGLLAPAMVYAEKPVAWLPARAHAVPKETATEGEGYFSIIEGHNGRLYVGTHANGVNSWLVEFDPVTRQMVPVVDCHKAIGKDLKGFGSQAKIHTRNNVGASGKIYFGTKQGYPSKTEKREDYPGGYPLVYDPATGQTKVYPIPVPHQGINSIMPDESRGVAYISTCSDGRPGPGENSVFLILDLNTGKYKELIDTHHVYGFICLDHLGRAYHPLLGGDVVRYDPRTQKVETLKQTIDGHPPAAELHLADRPSGHPLNWDAAPDGKTLYCVPMSTNRLFAYDLTADGNVLPGRDLGPLVPTAHETDCRALCVGPTGQVWACVTTDGGYAGVRMPHLVSFTPGDKAPHDRGVIAISNPDYTPFTDAASKPLPFHGGTFRTPDGVMTSRHVTLGICQGKSGDVYVLMLQPYTVLEVTPDALKDPKRGEELFIARPLTDKNSFTAGIEGPACDAAGDLFLVALKSPADIAKVTPDGKAEVWVTLPGKIAGNGIVFDKKGTMFVADYTGHNVLRIDPKTKKVDVFAHEPTMNQPNDLAIAPDGTLYASDPNWSKGTGQLWKIGTDGKVTKLAADMGTTNGIEVSPDGKTLYVNESVQRNIWAFPIQPDGTLGAKRLFKKFDDHGFDGMRCDADGNLYVTRHGKGTVVKLSPKAEVLQEIDVLGKNPSNLCFSGPDGRTVYVTEVEHRRVVTFRVDKPGLAWERLHAK
jgi:sugar lactone lactonase YvrE